MSSLASSSAATTLTIRRSDMRYLLHVIAWLGIVAAAVGLASCGGGGDAYVSAAPDPKACAALVKLDGGPATCAPEN